MPRRIGLKSVMCKPIPQHPKLEKSRVRVEVRVEVKVKVKVKVAVMFMFMIMPWRRYVQSHLASLGRAHQPQSP